jgi:hypothetical protein
MEQFAFYYIGLEEGEQQVFLDARRQFYLRAWEAPPESSMPVFNVV